MSGRVPAFAVFHEDGGDERQCALLVGEQRGDSRSWFDLFVDPFEHVGGQPTAMSASRLSTVRAAGTFASSQAASAGAAYLATSWASRQLASGRPLAFMDCHAAGYMTFETK
jgi:hypothetical protein